MMAILLNNGLDGTAALTNTAWCMIHSRSWTSVTQCVVMQSCVQ